MIITTDPTSSNVDLVIISVDVPVPPVPVIPVVSVPGVVVPVGGIPAVVGSGSISRVTPGVPLLPVPVVVVHSPGVGP